MKQGWCTLDSIAVNCKLEQEKQISQPVARFKLTNAIFCSIERFIKFNWITMGINVDNMHQILMLDEICPEISFNWHVKEDEECSNKVNVILRF